MITTKIIRKTIEILRLTKRVLDIAMCANGWLTFFLIFAFKEYITIDTLIIMLSINTPIIILWVLKAKDKKVPELLKYSGKREGGIK